MLEKPDGFFGFDTAPAGGKKDKEKKSGGPAALAAEFKNGLPWFSGGKTLGKQEAEGLHETLTEAILSDFDYLDQAIWGYTRDEQQRQIWSSADEKDCATIARVMLKRGQRSPAAAAAVRGIVESQDYIDVGMIVLPRLHQTVKRVREAPPRERLSRPARMARMRAVQQQQPQTGDKAA